MKPTIDQQKESLQNFANKFNFEVHTYIFEDKRKSTLFFLHNGNNTISPKLDYDNMNSFLLGYSRAKNL